MRGAYGSGGYLALGVGLHLSKDVREELSNLTHSKAAEGDRGPRLDILH